MGRKERRKAERDQRREETERRMSPMGQAIVRRAMAKQAAIERLSQQGISPEFLQKAVDKAYREGYQAAGTQLLKGVYASVILALHNECGFGHKRITKVLRAVDENFLTMIDGQEMIDRVWAETKIELRMNEGVNRIQEVE